MGICSLLLGYAVLIDLRKDRRGSHLVSDPHLFLKLTIVAGLFCAMVDFADAWKWAGRQGPVNRLAPRACGTALGFAMPAIVVLHALYFHWFDPLETAFGKELMNLLERALRMHAGN